MAKRIKKFEPPKGGGGRTPTYPWSTWFDGSTWELVQGRDFKSTIETMQKFIRSTAQKMNVLISVYRMSENKLVITPRNRAAV